MGQTRSERPKIVITDGDYFAPGFIEQKMPHLLAWGEVSKVQTYSEDELIEALSQADAAVIRRVAMTRQVFASCPRLLGIAKMGAGVENIDIQAASDYSILVANSPAVTIAVAEAALLLMMTVTKPLQVMLESAKRGQLPPSEARGTELYGKTVGIVGFGQIGSHLAKITKGMGMKVLIHDPYVQPSEDYEFVPLDDLLSRADFVSLNCPLTAETAHLIGARQLGLIKPSAVLVNTARGGVVDEAALVEALEEGRLRGAGLDVVEHEPLQVDNPLLKLPNAVVTPHALARTWESISKVSDLIEQAIWDILAGGIPQHALNPKISRKPSPFAETLEGEPIHV
jgi:D-3-phosphoglycerate dehydrogenase